MTVQCRTHRFAAASAASAACSRVFFCCRPWRWLRRSTRCPHGTTVPPRQAIFEFVQTTTDTASPKFVRPEDRIATFDQDGTLWVEHPMYTQVMYCLDRVPALVKEKPELERRRAVQDGAVRRPRGDREALDGGP